MANDADAKRAFMLTHQMNRLNTSSKVLNDVNIFYRHGDIESQCLEFPEPLLSALARDKSRRHEGAFRPDSVRRALQLGCGDPQDSAEVGEMVDARWRVTAHSAVANPLQGSAAVESGRENFILHLLAESS